MHAQIYTGTYSVCTVCNNTVFNNADPEEMNAARSRCDTAHKFSINTGLPGTFFFSFSAKGMRACVWERTHTGGSLFVYFMPGYGVYFARIREVRTVTRSVFRRNALGDTFL